VTTAYVVMGLDRATANMARGRLHQESSSFMEGPMTVFDQAVGKDEQGCPDREASSPLHTRRGRGPQGSRRLHVQEARASIHHQERWWVAGGCDPKVPVVRVDAGDQQGGHALQLEVVPALAQHLDELTGSGGLIGQNTGGRSDLPHDGRRLHVMTGDVSDGDGDIP
jgi:hypothetical protein